MVNNITECRSCGASDLKEILYFGETPLADRLIQLEDLQSDEAMVPLTLLFCNECSLVQLKETVDPHELFGMEYPYYSSVSPALLKHTKSHVDYLIKDHLLDESSLVIEIASNDGYLLQFFNEQDIPVLGVDPAVGPAGIAIQKGIPTLNSYFNKATAVKILKEHGKADIILANNVLAHVADLHGLIEGVKLLLKEKGVFEFEVPYLKDLIDKTAFDTIYHQHLCYFSVHSLHNLLKKYNLYINKIKHISIHGGSLRVSVSKYKATNRNLNPWIEMEKEEGMDHYGYYTSFSDDIKLIKAQLLELLSELKKNGNKIVGYGAAAKAVTISHFIGIDDRYLDFIVDLNHNKHGLFFSGNHLTIYPVEKLIEEQPDYTLLFSWNFQEEIIEQQKQYINNGGKFIIPIPFPKIVS